MNAGDTYIRAGKHVNTDPHLWIVISDPAKDKSRLVAVNVTSQRIDKDQSCVIYAGEHEFITRESVVLFSGARIVPESAILGAVSAALLKFQKRVSAGLLSRIRLAAGKTIHLPLAAKRILQSQDIIPQDS
jgi:hypothetical protein